MRRRSTAHWNPTAVPGRDLPAHQADGQPLLGPASTPEYLHTAAPHPEHTEPPASLPPTSAPLISVVSAPLLGLTTSLLPAFCSQQHIFPVSQSLTARSSFPPQPPNPPAPVHVLPQILVNQINFNLTPL